MMVSLLFIKEIQTPHTHIRTHTYKRNVCSAFMTNFNVNVEF